MDISQLLSHRPLTPSASPSVPETVAVGADDDQANIAQQLGSTARQFEAIFLHQLVKQMQESVEYASFDEEDESGEQIQSMYWSFMADTMANQGGIGLWKSIYNDLAGSYGIDVQQFPAERQLDEQI